MPKSVCLVKHWSQTYMEATVFEALDRLASVLAGGGLAVVAACLVGRTAIGQLRRLRGKLTLAEGWLLAFGCGSAVLSTLVFALCAVGWFYDATALGAFAAIALAWYRWGRWNWSAEASETGPTPRFSKLLLYAPAAIYGVLYIVHTLAPETRADAMGYHLGLVHRYYRSHGFESITTNVYAQLSQGAEMLYLFAYSIGRESAAKLVHLSFLIATAGGILCLAKRFRAELAGVFATVVYFTCPVVIPDATAAYIDCALAFTLFAVFCVLLLWWRDGDRQWLAVLGVLIGFSFAIKYTGATAITAAFAAALHRLSKGDSTRSLAGLLAWAGVPAAVVGLPWLAKNAIFTGNPLAPFFNGWFPNPYFSVEWETAYKFAMRSYRQGPFDRWEQLLAAPFDLVIGERYAGSLGWMILLLPIAMIAWKKPLTRALLAAAVISATPWFANAGARFLIPSLPFAFLAIGLALDELPRRLRPAIVALLLVCQCVTSWPAQRSRWYHPDLWSVEGMPWRAALRLEPQKWHLARNVKFFLLADRIGQLGGNDMRVLSFTDLPEAYFDAELLVSYQGLENQDLADAVLAPLKPAHIPDSAVRAAWPQRLVRGVRVDQARDHNATSWSVSEVRVLSNGRPIRASPQWIARAQPLPWHADRLVDGNPFTKWSSRQPAASGMELEIRFDRSISVDGVELMHPRGAVATQATLEFAVLTPAGAWERVRPESFEFVGTEVAPGAACTSAAAQLRQHGIDYVVFNMDPRDPYFPQARAVASEPGRWGLRKVFVDRTAMLFEVLPEKP